MFKIIPFINLVTRDYLSLQFEYVHLLYDVSEYFIDNVCHLVPPLTSTTWVIIRVGAVARLFSRVLPSLELIAYFEMPPLLSRVVVLVICLCQ